MIDVCERSENLSMKYLEKHNQHLILNQEAIKKGAIGKPEKPTDNTFPQVGGAECLTAFLILPKH